MKSYDTVIFDLFNTVALWYPQRMPRYARDGEPRPSTLGLLIERLSELVPELSANEFVDAFETANMQLARERDATQREFPSRERFRRCLVQAGLADNAQTATVAENLSLLHMSVLREASAVPNSHREFLQHISNHYGIALISNFDHADTANHILKRDDVIHFFDPLIISESHGWRKPARKIFTDTLELLNLQADQVLFVGDSFTDDVVGAANAGIDVAWVNAKGQASPDDALHPTYTIESILDLGDILSAAGHPPSRG